MAGAMVAGAVLSMVCAELQLSTFAVHVRERCRCQEASAEAANKQETLRKHCKVADTIHRGCKS